MGDRLPLDTRPVEDFVRTALPTPPARVLEVGAGLGDLAVDLRTAGHDVTATDPDPDRGPDVRAGSLYDVATDEGPFDAVVASRVLHHLPELGGALDHLALLLADGGRLIVNDFAREAVEGRAAAWMAAWLTHRDASWQPADADACLAEFHEGHAGIHSGATLHAALAARFHVIEATRAPVLAHGYLDRDPAAEDDERHRCRMGTLPAVGRRWVAVRATGQGGDAPER
ncbi:class I SAM-dependent methyltransferase [Egibacter rhizosphaerae]|uniref:class I SAM-dependent methyltransferase n=1 Tax=Egibacter rhizosphaerae TaxID=1670831 RepID=UPI0013F14B1C|nr:class I SAM-dependent methyltransferase [Egibacter rhizosphaerae]